MGKGFLRESGLSCWVLLSIGMVLNSWFLSLWDLAWTGCRRLKSGKSFRNSCGNGSETGSSSRFGRLEKKLRSELPGESPKKRYR
jgi:hypothetical protein